MEKRTRVFVTFFVIILLISGLYIFTDWFSQVTGYFIGESEVKSLALCLRENGAEFYGSTYCPDCEKTKNIFGQSFTFITYIDCGKEMESCPNLREVPAWFIDKQIHYGFKTIEEIKEMSGCLKQ